MENLELYRAFYWTAVERNLSRAAERLFITQPSVSHAIKQLEEALSVTLFNRMPKGVTLTEVGALLFEHVDKAFRELESAERQIAEINNLVRGELRIGSSDSLCKYYLLPHLGQFYNEHPDIHLDLVHGTTPEIIRQVKDGRIDFGIVRLPLNDDSLVTLEATVVQDCFVAGGRFAELASKPLSLADLAAHYPIILFAKTSSSRQFIQELAAQLGVELQPEIELASVDLLIEFAKAGMGISFVTKQFVMNELEAGELTELKLKESIPPRRIGIVYMKNRRLSPASRALIEQHLQVKLP
ncbi:LysR family transcriptional regulator [Paenibacillus terricola]|nr:LysR family transcriptional regulator [Paenibacillus terricola]